jgi:hypothetical protein
MKGKESRGKITGRREGVWGRKKQRKLGIKMGSFQSVQVRGTKLQNFLEGGLFLSNKV